MIIIASGPVIIENNKVLLDKHGDDNFWKFPGGRVEDYETDLIKTAKRKVKKEMGLDIKIINPEPIIPHTRKDDGTDVILVHFMAKRINEIKPGQDVKKWDWFDINNLPNDCAPNIKPVVEQDVKK